MGPPQTQKDEVRRTSGVGTTWAFGEGVPLPTALPWVVSHVVVPGAHLLMINWCSSGQWGSH